MLSDVFSLQGKVALVTGSGRGIGAAIARTFAEAGAAVVVTGRTQADLDSVAGEIEQAGGKALPIAIDFTDLDGFPGLIAQIVEAFGGLDIIVNNAGGSRSPAFVDTTLADIDKEHHLIVRATFELARLALPHLLKSGEGSIVNTLGPGAHMGSTRGNLAYWSAKAALARMTELMAADLGPRIRVNGIIPGPVETPSLKQMMADKGPAFAEMVTGTVRMRRLAQPEDIAYGALYLASRAASFVTGIMLPINGGEVGERRQISPDL